MADLVAALMDLYARQSYPEIADPVSVVMDAELPNYDLGVDKDTMRGNLESFADKTALAESTRNRKAKSGVKGKAAGAYQWLTEVSNGEGQPAFRTALNRLERYYTKQGKRIAPWIEEAKEHNDPTKLSQREQDALFFADIFQRKGTTTEKGRGYEQGKLQEIMKNANPDVMNDVYLEHWHTRPKDMSDSSWQRVLDNARRSYYEELQ